MYSANPELAGPESDSKYIDRIGAERPPSLLRKCGEFMLYGPVLAGAFLQAMGLNTVRFAGSGMLLFSGVVVLFMILVNGEKFPKSIWFALAMNVGANISQGTNGEPPLLGSGLPLLFFWVANLYTTWWVIQNRGAEGRTLVFYVLLLVLLAAVGGKEEHAADRVVRLGFEGAGGGIGNANTIAYMSGTFSVALLFWSLRARAALRPVMWFLAMVSALILVRTVSRTGIGMFGIGLMFFIAATMAGKGMRISGFAFICFVAVVMVQFASLWSDPLEYLQRRMELKTAESRMGIYSLDTLADLRDSTPFGRGPERAQTTSTGIAAHNTFVYMYQAFGAVTAWPYLAWLGYLSLRVYRAVRSREISIVLKLELVAYLVMTLIGEMTNNINFVTYSTVFEVAMIEKFTTPLTPRAVEARHALQYAPAPEQQSWQIQPAWR